MLSNLTSWVSVFTIPTSITLIRFLMVPCIVMSMLNHAWYAAVLFFMIAAISDVLDGALARFLKRVTFLGSFLDPLADKLLLIASYTTLAVLAPFATFAIPLWFLLFVVGSEVILVFFSFYWGVIRRSMVIKPTRLGRMAGLAQILFIGWLFCCRFACAEPIILFYLLIVLVACARLCAFIQYGMIAFTRPMVEMLVKE